MKENIVSEKTIEVVFEEFFQEQEARLKPKTLNGYQDVLHLFKESLNGHAYQYLDKKETALFDKFYEERGEKHKEFCQIFGPEKILENVDEFVNYFMIRKVMCSKELKKTTGTVIKKLGKWLLDKKYIDDGDSEEMVDSGKQAATDLPAAEDFLNMLIEHIEDSPQPSFGEDDLFEDRFEIAEVKPGKLYLSPLNSTEDIVITVPRSISNSCKEGWFISGVVGEKGKTAKFTEVWNVYP